MARVVHFEIPADDPERAVKLYGNVFGWDIQTWGGPADYWLANTGPEDERGINGGVMRRPAWGTCTIHISVSSLDDHLRRVGEAGGEIVQPKSPIPGVGFMAYCRDTEGNVFGVFQEDPASSP